MGEPFSLLMSVYGGDDPAFLEAAYRSVVHDQTRPPGRRRAGAGRAGPGAARRA